MLQGPRRDRGDEKLDRIRVNFSELYDQTAADDRPLAVTDEIIMMLMDDDEAKLRIEGLFKKYEDSNSNCCKREQFQQELDLIAKYGVYDAVNSHGLNLQVLCRMVDDPALCQAAHLAFINSDDGFIAQSPLPRLS